MDMNTNALVIGWNRSNEGKGKEGVELFGKFLGWLGEHQKKGTITSFMPVSMLAHGGDLNGFVLVHGETSSLQKLQNDEMFHEFVLHGQVTMNGLGVIPAFTGDVMMNRMQKMAKYF